MPIYEYECTSCKFYTELIQKISDAPLKKCPSCGKSTMKKLISAPVFRLKGGGWYETDFKSDQESKRNLAGDGSEGTAAKTDDAAAATEAKTADGKPADAKPADAKAADRKPDAKAAEKTPPAASRSASKSAAAKPAKSAAKPAARPAAKAPARKPPARAKTKAKAGKRRGR
jgi:putative FmdB family regulatory protein